MFSTGTAAEIAARYDDTAVRKGCSNIFVYAAQAMAADFLRIGQSENCLLYTSDAADEL